MSARVELSWTRDGRVFRAVEPDAALVDVHAARLAAWYNLEPNAALMGNTTHMSEDDVRAFWTEHQAGGARAFLLFADDVLAGDADLRNLADGHGEFAVMIGALEQQGRGLGTTFAAMVHVFAFRELGLDRLYVELKPENVRVQRLDRRLGYELDDSPEARALAEDDSAVTMSIGPQVFREKNDEAWRGVVARTIG